MVKVRYLACVGVVIMLVSQVWGFNIATHMYWGTRPEVLAMWEDFDSEFASDLNGLLVRKFYLIGLTLPDLLDQGTQEKVAALIDTFYDMGNMYSLSGPLLITNTTHEQVQQLIQFNGEAPNHNLRKLWEMVLYARDQGWSSYEKALIYGTYMHVLQDLYAHMILQPSFYGYDYAVEGDSSNRDFIGVGSFETFYELFTSTYIDDWSFIDDLYKATMWNGSQFVRTVHGAVEFYFKVSESGSIIARWQNMDFPPVEKFVEAAQHVNYATSSLTRESHTCMDGLSPFF